MGNIDHPGYRNDHDTVIFKPEAPRLCIPAQLVTLYIDIGFIDIVRNESSLPWLAESWQDIAYLYVTLTTSRTRWLLYPQG